MRISFIIAGLLGLVGVVLLLVGGGWAFTSDFHDQEAGILAFIIIVPGVIAISWALATVLGSYLYRLPAGNRALLVIGIILCIAAYLVWIWSLQAVALLAMAVNPLGVEWLSMLVFALIYVFFWGILVWWIFLVRRKTIGKKK